MTEAQSLMFQVAGTFVGLGFLAFITVRNRWPALRAGVSTLATDARERTQRLLVRLRDEAPVNEPSVLQGPILVGDKVSYVAWANILNQQPDRYPHTLIIGPTGAGKTTFTMALLSTRAGQIAILTPKPDPQDWPNAPITTIDDAGTFDDLTATFNDLNQEIRARLAATKRRAAVGAPLTIVCDDWPVLASECGRAASDLFKLVGRLGRSLRVRLVVLSQSERVRSLGLEGEGDAVTNFVRVDLARNHSAQLLTDGVTLALDTSWVPQLASRPTDPARWWQPATDETDADRLLSSALGIDDSQRLTTGVAGVATPYCEPTGDCSQQRSEAPESPTQAIVVRLDGIDWPTVARLVRANAVGETRALQGLGYTPGSTNARYQAARAALHQALGRE